MREFTGREDYPLTYSWDCDVDFYQCEVFFEPRKRGYQEEKGKRTSSY